MTAIEQILRVVAGTVAEAEVLPGWGDQQLQKLLLDVARHPIL